LHDCVQLKRNLAPKQEPEPELELELEPPPHAACGDRPAERGFHGERFDALVYAANKMQREGHGPAAVHNSVISENGPVRLIWEINEYFIKLFGDEYSFWARDIIFIDRPFANRSRKWAANNRSN
jgi:hypothetical protein